MKVKALAFKTLGLGCIEGDKWECANAQRVDDKGTYFEVVIHENWSRRFTKEAWTIQTEG